MISAPRASPESSVARPAITIPVSRPPIPTVTRTSPRAADPVPATRANRSRTSCACSNVLSAPAASDQHCGVVSNSSPDLVGFSSASIRRTGSTIGSEFLFQLVRGLRERRQTTLPTNDTATTPRAAT